MSSQNSRFSVEENNQTSPAKIEELDESQITEEVKECNKSIINSGLEELFQSGG